jgi:hypothetical protein
MQAGALAERQDGDGDLVHRIAADKVVADDAVHGSTTGIKQPHVVVDLGCGGDRGTRVPCRVLLLDGDGRSESGFSMRSKNWRA